MKSQIADSGMRRNLSDDGQSDKLRIVLFELTAIAQLVPDEANVLKRPMIASGLA